MFDSLSIQEEELSAKDKNKKLCTILYQIYKELGIPENLTDFKIGKEDIPELIDSIRPSFGSAPVKFDDNDAYKLLNKFIL